MKSTTFMPFFMWQLEDVGCWSQNDKEKIDLGKSRTSDKEVMQKLRRSQASNFWPAIMCTLVRFRLHTSGHA